jgi:hypothetical protein
MTANDYAQRGRAQVLFREVNKRIAEVIVANAYDGPMFFVCECSDESCAETIELSAAEYDLIRQDPLTFFVTPGHEQHDIERVERGTDRYVVVEKLGEAAAAIRASTPPE